MEPGLSVALDADLSGWRAATHAMILVNGRS